MKNMKRIIGVGALFIIGACGLSSCDDNFEKIQFDALGDCYVQKQKVGEEVKYGATYYAFANMDIKKVMLTTPGENGQTFELEQQGENTRIFRLIPDILDFTSEMPTEGDYTFTIISNEQDTIISKDKLLTTDIPAVEIEEFTYEQETHNVKLDWNAIEDADLYVVRLLEEKNGKILYISPMLSKSEYEFTQSTPGWLNGIEMEDSENYILGVFAYKYENSSQKSGYDLQMECVDYREINW